MAKPKWSLRGLVLVDWEDANSHGGWSSIEEYRKKSTAVCRSVGYVVKKDKRELHLAQTIDQGDKMTDSISIPRGCVKRIVPIRRLR